ncbi:hypothetical protein BJP34_10410 [Moorena producens PAL-8-15-08-1]|uniref:Thioesterase domain-containing protein n=1 Tax=Moorena producens PAL-8-15-08-1 TaxID=1458985 RepID=A0A1D8TQ64_9CYAN|nr:tetratricopeptide repeat protein [Moorena producens]AOW99810.1 hypothetical protein BJP34_10410 [Moorena producens PAL-8-15-08-1]
MASSTPKQSGVNPSSQTQSETKLSDFPKAAGTNAKLKDQAPPVNPVQHNENLPLSFAQERVRLTLPQLSPEIYHQLRLYTLAWKGKRVRPKSLIVGMNTNGSKQPLFWCLQGFRELTQLAKYLGFDQPIYGMRSGHLIMKYTQKNIQALAAHYLGEILAVEPDGPYLLGGNCQSASIIFEIAQQLISQGKTVTLLCLVERFIPRPYPGPIALLFGRQSKFNPYKFFRNPELGWSKFYPGELYVDLVPGRHGEFFNEPKIQVNKPKIQVLVEKVQYYIEKTQSQPTPPQLPLNQTKYPLLPNHAYRAQLTAPTSLVALPGQTLVIEVKVKNLSSLTWLETAKSGIRVGNHWLDHNGKVRQWSDGRVDLGSDLPPDSEIELFLEVTTPMAEGHYCLELDLVEEGITWFKHKGSKTTTVQVSVNPDPHEITKEQANSEVYRRRGDSAFEKGDFETAILNYQNALQLSPSGPVEVYKNLGDALSQKQKFSEAITAYTEALKLQPDHEQVYFRLGSAQLMQQDLNGAIASYQKGIELSVEQAWMYRMLGQAFQYQGNLESAIATYTKAIALQPDHAITYILLGNAHLLADHLELAMANYNKAIQLQPDQPGAYHCLGNAQLQAKDVENAIASYHKAIALNPEYFPAYKSLGDLFKELKKLDEAIAAYDKALKLQPNNRDVASSKDRLMWRKKLQSGG